MGTVSPSICFSQERSRVACECLKFVCSHACVARLGWHLRQEAAEGFPRAYVCACLAGLAGSLAAGMLADWFLPFVYNIGFAGFRASMLGWMWLGGMVAVRKMAHRGNTFSSSEH